MPRHTPATCGVLESREPPTLTTMPTARLAAMEGPGFQPPDIAPMTKSGSFPATTSAGSSKSGSSCDRSS